MVGFFSLLDMVASVFIFCNVCLNRAIYAIKNIHKKQGAFVLCYNIMYCTF